MNGASVSSVIRALILTQIFTGYLDFRIVVVGNFVPVFNWFELGFDDSSACKVVVIYSVDEFPFLMPNVFFGGHFFETPFFISDRLVCFELVAETR